MDGGLDDVAELLDTGVSACSAANSAASFAMVRWSVEHLAAAVVSAGAKS